MSRRNLLQAGGAALVLAPASVPRCRFCGGPAYYSLARNGAVKCAACPVLARLPAPEARR